MKIDLHPQGAARGPEALSEKTISHPMPRLTSSKIQGQHLERRAIVYVRQSTPQQVLAHRESRTRQYALVDYAASLGWSSERVEVIDEDQGHSGQNAEERVGFQRLLAEVTLDQVGLILGLEMSRLARSDKDWHQLLELCAIFGTLLADQDGVYDAADPNDRLLLGLKGTMSTVELHTMRNRLEKGKLCKAQRGALFLHLPVGYVKLPSGEVVQDPDEQVRAVVSLIFDKFEELGTVSKVFRYLLQHDIRLGVRPHAGPNRGQVEWRRPCRTTLYGILHHPIYAGTYAYGRCPVDPKRKHAGRSKKGRRWVPREQWKVVRHGQLPAYITWDRYLRNQERLKQNRSQWEAAGTPRRGAALLGGLLFCGRCGTRMNVYYSSTAIARYDCVKHFRHGHERTCHGLRASVLDALVAQQVLRALEPVALELSLRAGDDIQRERERLSRHWQQQLERARYETQQAERRYRAVDAENRLVARTLEQQWEQALRQERQLDEDFARFRQQTPPQVTAAERERIQALAADLPALWQAPGTSATDRKEIIRCLVERVDVRVQGNTENVDVTIHWAGGFQSQHQVQRPIHGYRQLRDYERFVQRIRELKAEGHTAAQIAAQLGREGFHPPPGHGPFNKQMVRQLLSRWGLSGGRNEDVALGPDEWWLSDLARQLDVHTAKLRGWIRRGWVHGRRSPRLHWCILRADLEELERLQRLRAHAEAHPFTPYPPELTVPKPGTCVNRKHKGAGGRKR
jgi:DNA invertase Pin-like site-specific DNA recombinase